jgi:hypothetical protein
VLLEEKPQRNPSADGYLCATLACGLMPVACLSVVTSMPERNETGATNGTDGTIYFRSKVESRYLVFAMNENAGVLSSVG